MSVLSQCFSIKIVQGISAPGHYKEVADSINAIHKRFIYQLISNVQLKGLKIFNSQTPMNSCTPKKDASLDIQFQTNLSKEHRKNGVIDQIKYRKRARTKQLIDIYYHVQDSADVAQKYLKMYCDTNQFPALTLCGPHPKPPGARWLNKHYHICFDQKLGHGICEIFRIPCACVGCTSIL